MSIQGTGAVNLGAVTTNGLTGFVTGGSITTGNITTNGGNTILTSQSGSVTTGNVTTSGGNLDVKAATTVSMGVIDTSAATSGGNVFLDPPGVITVQSINTQGGTGLGGSVEVLTGNLQVLSSFVDQNGIDASISTAGGTEGGDITIRYAGGLIPFVVGDASINGTAAAITSGANNTILPVQRFPVPYTQGNIRLIPLNPLPNLDKRETPVEIPQAESNDTILVAGDVAREAIGNTLAQGAIEKAVPQIEQLWESQYESYFGEDAEKTPQTAESIRETLGKIAQQTDKKPAVIYLMVQPERVDLVLLAPGMPSAYRSVPIARPTLLKLVEDFRKQITDPNEDNYLESAQKLYQVLIAPLDSLLKEQGIDTLLLAPDSGLRSLPLAALHDGRQFLVEKNSLGLIPSVSLMNTRYLPLRNASVLAMGASQFKEQAPLPAVPVELPAITRALGQGKYLLEDAFTVANLRAQRQQQPFQIVHLATHGEFRPGAPQNSYIQFWNERLGLDQIRQLQFKNPLLELLVLSACRTAVGNEQAEFGFAGLAVQSGAKSALASLWYVSDEGTLGLMTEFYDRIKKTTIKSEALRQAQLAMIRKQVKIGRGQLLSTRGPIPLPAFLNRESNYDFSHPYYWAGFTMIGSPW